MTDSPKPKPIPKPIPRPKAVTPAVVAAHASHPVKVPVAAEATEEQLAAAAAFGEVVDGVVWVRDGEERHEAGPAQGDDALAPYCRAYYELTTSLERFHARLGSAELSPGVIDENLAALTAALEKPAVVGDLAAARARLAEIEEEAGQVRERLKAERAQARAEAVAARERIVAQAEALAAKNLDAIHWKQDTAALRELLDSWKEAQRGQARIPKDVERALWKRFTAARTVFERQRKHHFADLDKTNADVKARKEALVAQAQKLAESTDWDGTARAFRDLMEQWKSAGHGRRPADQALWEQFRTAQDAFFAAKKATESAAEDALSGNVAAKEAVVADAEALLPVTDVASAKQALRSLQDRFEAAGQVPRADTGRLNKRMAAVERAVREADEAEWSKRNPEIEARASGAAQQLEAAIADLERQLAAATESGDKKKAASLQESLDARRAWLEQIQGVVS